MKTIVVYKSKTGFTKVYAKAISERLDCELVSFNETKKINLNEYDCVIYGAGLMAGRMYNIEKLKDLIDENQELILFATGATYQDSYEVIERIKKENLELLGRKVNFYYFEGGVNYEKLGFLPKKMLQVIHRSLSKKENRTEEEENMMEALSQTHNHVHIEYIDSLLENMK